MNNEDGLLFGYSPDIIISYPTDEKQLANFILNKWI